MLTLRQASQQHIPRLLAAVPPNQAHTRCVSSSGFNHTENAAVGPTEVLHHAPGTVAAASLPDGPVGFATGLIDGLHSVTGLPWWATLSVTAIGLRAMLFPLSVKQIQASGALAAHLQQVNSQKGPAGHDSTASALYNQMARWRQAAAASKSTGSPSPLWIVAAPLAQIPLFVTAVVAVRRMSLAHWPGLDTGGVLWFPDLCEVALDLAALHAPLGSVGVALPGAVALAMFVNINRTYGDTADSKSGNAVMQWVKGNLKLVLEWVTVPLFVIALQLPQGAVLYWLTFSLTSMAQGYILQLPSARAVLGLAQPSQAVSGELGSQQAQRAQQAQQAQQPKGQTSKQAPLMQSARPGQPISSNHLLEVPNKIWKLAARSKDAKAMLLKAAELRAEGAIGASQHCLKRVLALQPSLPQGHFALGQNHAALKQWPLAEQAFLQAADLHQDSYQKARRWFGTGIRSRCEKNMPYSFWKDLYQQARCWFGTGIAQQMQGEPDAALQSLENAVTICLDQMQQHSSLEQPDTGQLDVERAQQAVQQKDAMQQSSAAAQSSSQRSKVVEGDIGPERTAANILAKGLCVKVLLAKASILRQLQRHQEADVCMHEAKDIDPAVGKYVKH